LVKSDNHTSEAETLRPEPRRRLTDRLADASPTPYSQV
jgi:hypothetical protein